MRGLAEVIPMKLTKQIFLLGCGLSALLFTLPCQAISDEEFRAIQQQTQQQLQLIQDLQKEREHDQKELQVLKKRVGQTEQKSEETRQIAESAKLQPVHPVPTETLDTHNFTMVGDAEVQYQKIAGQNGGFLLADFAPIFLYRASDKVLFEAGADITLQNSGSAPANSGAGTSFSLSFATLDYLLNDYATLVAGYMLLPLGTYTERSAGWLNKLPDDPLPRGVLPSNGAGAQLRGSFGLGESGAMLTYAGYAANGPSSSDSNGFGHATALDLGGNVGVKSDGSTASLNGSPSYGGRLGVFVPLKAHYDIELGASGQNGAWANSGNGDLRWSAAVFDAAIHLSPFFETKGEYIATRFETDDTGTIDQGGWWVQASYKLAGFDLDLPLVNDLELVGRYDTVHDGLGMRQKRFTTGVVYYLMNTLQVEGAYEFASSSDDSLKNMLVVQLSYGF